ncbi:hypothetical protein EE612_046227, partial [Oryza sativa]
KCISRRNGSYLPDIDSDEGRRRRPRFLLRRVAPPRLRRRPPSPLPRPLRARPRRLRSHLADCHLLPPAPSLPLLVPHGQVRHCRRRRRRLVPGHRHL